MTREWVKHTSRLLNSFFPQFDLQLGSGPFWNGVDQGCALFQQRVGF